MTEVVIQQAVNLVGEFEKANEISLTPLSSNHWAAQTWEAPPLGVCKINSDVACFRDASTGLGCVVRDHVGDVLLSTCWRSREEYDVDIGEALAARHSLSISLEAGFRKVGRMGNGVAHRLAKASIMYDVMRVWMEEVPECAADAVLQDILSLS
uniref:RNase H type-1 domain-containing protein n=1 Tax=Chenopodium quinoa TaxID=63459 RepID=A0A803MIF0_CHEQI